MQDEIARLQEKLQRTVLFVTHDLDEAIRLGDRMAVMRAGEFVQVAGPAEMLARPADDYVARFVDGARKTAGVAGSNGGRPRKPRRRDGAAVKPVGRRGGRTRARAAAVKGGRTGRGEAAWRRLSFTSAPSSAISCAGCCARTATFLIRCPGRCSACFWPSRTCCSWIPWWVVVAAASCCSRWLLTRSVWGSLALGGLLIVVVGFGLWAPTMNTLAIVITSVILALAIGIPIGILMAEFRPVNAVMKPILDVMQTMPSFVYLIPAMMLLGLGKVPAVLATWIYAAPPIIRLTHLGVEQVSGDVQEAALAYGATPLAAAQGSAPAAGHAVAFGRRQPDDDDGLGHGRRRVDDRCPRRR